MSNDKMSDELQIAIRRSPDYTAPSAELVALRAEVAAWRRAVRWVHDDDHGSTLKVGANPKRAIAVGGTTQYSDGTWSAWPLAASELGEVFSDRNTACAKVCELLGMPVVLPVGGE